jgi:ankyrin repeat protein
LWAVRAANVDIARALLDASADPNCLDVEGRALLYSAVSTKNLALTQLLLEHGARVNPSDEGLLAFLDNPLRIAVGQGDERMVELLLSRGAKTLDSARFTMDGPAAPTVLEQAIETGSLAITKLLLEHGVSVNAADDEDYASLDFAANSGRIEFVELLLAHGANPAHSDAWSEAQRRGDSSMAAFLAAHGFPTEAEPSSDATSLEEAVAMGDRAMLETLLAQESDPEQLADKRQRALELAVASGNVAMVESLLAHGADPNAEQYGMLPLVIAAGGGDRAMVELLLARGADASKPTSSGPAALDHAVEVANVEIMTLLIARGAKPSVLHEDQLFASIALGDLAALAAFLNPRDDALRAVDENGLSPLHVAATKGQVELCRFLLDAGMPVDVIDPLGYTPLHWAGNDAVARALIDAGAAVDALDDLGDTPLAWAKDAQIAATLIAHAADVAHVNGEGMSPFMRATLGGRVEVMSYLLEHGATLDPVTDQGRTALDLAVRENVEASIEFLCARGAPGAALVQAVKNDDVARAAHFLDTEHFEEALGASALFLAVRRGRGALVELLLRAHALPNASDMHWRTPLRLAVEAGNTAVAAQLLDAGGDTEIAADDGRTPLWAAARRNDWAMLDLLATHGANLDWLCWSEAVEDDVTLLEDAIFHGNFDAAVFLLQHGASANVGRPLARAVQRGDAELVELLLTSGGQIWEPVGSEPSLLDLAVDAGFTAVVATLLDYGAKCNRPDAGGLRPLDRAERSNALVMANVLRAYGAFDESDLDQLYASFADPDVLRGATRTSELLHAAPEMVDVPRNGDPPLIAALSKASGWTVLAVVEAKPDVNLLGTSGRTALELAACRNAPIVEAVLSLGPDVNAHSGEQRRTALMAAVSAKEDTLKIMQQLLDRKADVNAKNAIGGTVLHYAVQRCEKDVVELLLRHGADANARMSDTTTVLMAALDVHRADMVAALLHGGADPNACCENPLVSPLILAAASGDAAATRLLIAAGGNVNGEVEGKNRPLHAAAFSGNAEVATLLLDAGAEVNGRPRGRITALDMAKDDAMRELLRARGGRTAKELN